MRSVLITGAAGFLGQHLAQAFARSAEPWQLTLTDQRGSAGESSAFAFELLDLRDAVGLAALLARHRITHVVHAAGQRHNIETAGDVLDLNLVPMLTLLEACTAHWGGQGGHFHLVSCAEVLQADVGGVVVDDGPQAPDSLYAASKGACEALLMGYAARSRFAATLSYPTMFYGAGQALGELVPGYIAALLQGRRVPLFGDGKAAIDLVHVADAAEAICAIVAQGAPGRRYGLRGLTASHAEILATLCRCIDACAQRLPEFAMRYDKSPAAAGRSSASLITRVQDRRATPRPRAYRFGAISEVMEDYYPRPLYDGLMECVTAALAADTGATAVLPLQRAAG